MSAASIPSASMPATSLSIVPSYTTGEEITNSILHGLGALGAMAGLVLLGLKTSGIFSGQREEVLDIIAVFLFTVTMIGMFLISTLYHAVQHQGAKRVLRRLDHAMIFIFIAGTYTPFCLSGLQGTWGWSLFAFEWILAFTGITLNIFGFKALKKIEIAAYVLMGWAIIAGFIPLMRSVPVQSIIMLIAGGIAYTLGIIWYKKKDVKYTHAVWHGFVIAGAICHWFAVWYLF